MTTSQSGTFPVLRVFGDPRERGRQYGVLARGLIHKSLACYAAVFDHYLGWDWPTVRRHAERFAQPIDEFAPSAVGEIAAMAEGSGVEVADILALNTRSEIMFAADPDASRPTVPVECTSFALSADRTVGGRILAGQNWDWIERVRDTTIVLRVHRPDGPDFVTLVEAGLLAKVGVNASGVGLCTNTLISDGDEGRIAVPYHVLLRCVLDSECAAEAVERIRSARRANSANYLISDKSGFCVDLETSPADDGFRALTPEDGVITHANHFLSADLTGEDRYLQRKQHTASRQRNLSVTLRARPRHGLDDLQAALADHRDAPNAVCQHPNAALPEAERTCTIAGVILDLAARSLTYSSGNPCDAPWHQESVDS